MQLFRFRALHGRAFPLRDSYHTANPEISRAIIFPLFLGILIGSLFGLYSDRLPAALDASFLLSEQFDSSGFLPALLHSIRYVALAALVSTSFLGFLLLPPIIFLRGVVLGCSVAALFSAGAYSGLLLAAFSIGIPAFLGLAALLPTANLGQKYSRLLFPSLRGGRAEFRLGSFLALGIPITLFCFAESAYRCWLLPIISNSLHS